MLSDNYVYFLSILLITCTLQTVVVNSTGEELTEQTQLNNLHSYTEYTVNISCKPIISNTKIEGYWSDSASFTFVTESTGSILCYASLYIYLSFRGPVKFI